MKTYKLKYVIEMPDDFCEIKFNQDLSRIVVEQGGMVAGTLEINPENFWKKLSKIFDDIYFLMKGL